MALPNERSQCREENLATSEADNTSATSTLQRGEILYLLRRDTTRSENSPFDALLLSRHFIEDLGILVPHRRGQLARDVDIGVLRSSLVPSAQIHALVERLRFWGVLSPSARNGGSLLWPI